MPHSQKQKKSKPTTSVKKRLQHNNKKIKLDVLKTVTVPTEKPYIFSSEDSSDELSQDTIYSYSSSTSYDSSYSPTQRRASTQLDSTSHDDSYSVSYVTTDGEIEVEKKQEGGWSTITTSSSSSYDSQFQTPIRVTSSDEEEEEYESVDPQDFESEGSGKGEATTAMKNYQTQSQYKRNDTSDDDDDDGNPQDSAARQRIQKHYISKYADRCKLRLLEQMKSQQQKENQLPFKKK